MLKKKPKKNDKFDPDILIPPGNSIKTYFKVLNIDTKEFCNKFKIDIDYFQLVLASDKPITTEIANGLQKTTNSPISFWISLNDKWFNNNE